MVNNRNLGVIEFACSQFIPKVQRNYWCEFPHAHHQNLHRYGQVPQYCAKPTKIFEIGDIVVPRRIRLTPKRPYLAAYVITRRECLRYGFHYTAKAFDENGVAFYTIDDFLIDFCLLWEQFSTNASFAVY